MPKSGVVGSAWRKQGRRQLAELPSAVEGQIVELCRDLAVEAKRMRLLQEQADELRRSFRQWVDESDTDSYREPPNRGERR
jgi:hypothetical protein